MAAGIEDRLLGELASGAGSVDDTGPWAEAQAFDHLEVVGVMKSLERAEMIGFQVCRDCQQSPG